MNTNPELLGAIEAVLMVAEEPIAVTELAAALEVPGYLVEQALSELAAEYLGEGGTRERGFVLREVGDGWRFYSNPRWSSQVSRLIVGKENAQLSQAALETLAIVAYRQPVTRAQIAAIRGVNVDSVVRSLQSRDLIDEVGSSPTGANLYGTTPTFLEKMGLSSVDELEPLAQFLPDVDSMENLMIGVEERI